MHRRPHSMEPEANIRKITVVSGKPFLCSVLMPLLALCVGCGIAVHRLTLQRAAIKNDFGVVNSIKYGLLSVDLWKDRIQEIVSGSIGEFALSREQENDLKNVISNALQALITEMDGLLQKRQKTLSGKIQKLVVKTFIDMTDIRKRVPALTQTIIDEIKKPENSARLKHAAQLQLNDYAAQSYDQNQDSSPLNRILFNYQTTSPAEFNNKTKGLISALDRKAAWYSRAMV